MRDSMTTHAVGQATVTRIEETYQPVYDPKELFPEFTDEILGEHRHWLAPNHYDRQRKLPAVDLVHQRSQSNTWKIEGRENTSRGGCGNFVEELCGVVVTLYDDRLARECVCGATALIRKRIDYIDGFGHEPSSGPC